MLYFFKSIDVAVEFCAHRLLETKALLKFVHRGTYGAPEGKVRRLMTAQRVY